MITTVDKYKDKIYIRFNESGDPYKGITKLPHYKIWIKILNHLKKRGFKIKTCKYHLEQNWAQALHKVATKENVIFTLECIGSQIKIEHGDIKNLWENETNFCRLTDSRGKSLTYLEGKKIELEVNKLLDIFTKNLIVNQDNDKLSPKDKIIKDKKESCHSKDKSKLDELGLDGVVYQMSTHDFTQNSTDRNKKQINCGELKYFYDYNDRLKCGIVYHQLNNRWFVLCSEKLHYAASYELFDFNGEPRRKQLTKEQKINKLESELKHYESIKNYIRCISINNQIEKLKTTEKLYNVWSLKWSKWWGVNNNGYTEDKRSAGIYLESNILAKQSYYNDGIINKSVLI